MKTNFLFCILFMFFGQFASADTIVVIKDDFTTNTKYVDLSKKLYWGGNNYIESSFILENKTDLFSKQFPAIFLINKAMFNSGYSPGTLRSSQCLDYKFPNKTNRDTFDILVEFDALWGTYNNNSYGETGRMSLLLLHDYPKNEIPFGTIDNVTATAPFGRPSYNLRLRNHNMSGAYKSGAFMLYGGGDEKDGAIEKYDLTVTYYWLPGSTDEPGTTTPGQSAAYPYSPTQKNDDVSVSSITQWKHYTWAIRKDKLEFYQRLSTQNKSADQVVFFMQTPTESESTIDMLNEINLAHGTNATQLPFWYKYFDNFEALRIYFRGQEQTYLANLTVKKVRRVPVSVSEYKEDNIIVRYLPSTSQLFVQIPKLQENTILNIYNLSGQIVYQQKLNKSNENFSDFISFTNFANGMYFVSIYGKQTMMRKKFCKIE